MEEEPSTRSNMAAPGSSSGNAGSNNFYIVGYNMLVLTIYTLALKFSKDLAGYFVDALLLVMHVLVCLAIAAKGPKVWMWVLSAVLVLAIGISTCVAIPPFLK